MENSLILILILHSYFALILCHRTVAFIDMECVAFNNKLKQTDLFNFITFILKNAITLISSAPDASAIFMFFNADFGSYF